MSDTQSPTSTITDTLIALVEEGPLWDGYIPSKVERDQLIEQGLATRVIVRGEDGYTAATYSGAHAYKKHYSADTLKEAKEKRIAGRKPVAAQPG